MARVSAKHALTEKELDFCKRRAAGLPTATAYRRAFLVEHGGVTFERATYNKAGQIIQGEGPEITAKEVSRRGSRLAKAEHIVAYLEEIGNPAGERARDVLVEQALFADEKTAIRAAEKILEQEERLGFRDGVHEFWKISKEIGGEIVVPLPERFKKTFKVACSHCDELTSFEVDEPLEAVVSVSEMFKGDKR